MAERRPPARVGHREQAVRRCWLVLVASLHGGLAGTAVQDPRREQSMRRITCCPASNHREAGS